MGFYNLEIYKYNSELYTILFITLDFVLSLILNIFPLSVCAYTSFIDMTTKTEPTKKKVEKKQKKAIF